MDIVAMQALVREIALPIVEECGCQLVGVEIVCEDEEWYLRVYIDKEGGVTLTDCTNVTRPLNIKIDEIEGLDIDYFEVSSPGPDRIINQEDNFENYIGQFVKAVLSQKVRDKDIVEGKLKGKDDQYIYIDVKGQLFKIENSKVLSLKLHEV